MHLFVSANVATAEITGAVIEAMEPFMNEMTTRLETVKIELNKIEDRVDDLNGDILDKKNQTKYQLLGLKNTFSESITSFSENFEAEIVSFDTRIAEEHRKIESQLRRNLDFDLNKIKFKLDLLDVHHDKLDAKVTLVNSELEQSIVTNLTEQLRKINGSGLVVDVIPKPSINDTLIIKFGNIQQALEEHIEETYEQFAELDRPSHEQLTETLVSLNTSLKQHVSSIKEELISLDDSLSIITNMTTSTTTTECEGYTCGGEGGWRRVAYFDMRDPTTICPTGWTFSGNFNQNRSCGRLSNFELSCDSVFFPVTGGDYNRVCGRIRAYQEGPVDAFEAYINGEVTTIDGAYVSGVSLTHGFPRQHIWTFAAGNDEYQLTGAYNCPCDVMESLSIPLFVGQDYFCESAVSTGSSPGFHPHDILWDGEDCSGTSTCCSFNNPPYFTKQLPSPTTDDLEARLCHWETGEDSPIELVELYVKGPNDGGSACVPKQDPLESKLDLFRATLSDEHQETRDELEEHKNQVNAELVELQIKQDDIESMIDTLDSQQDQLSVSVMSLTSEVEEMKNFLLGTILNFCTSFGPGSGDDPQSDYRCGGEGGWRRVVYLNITDPNTNCPSGWQLTAHSKRACGKVSTAILTCDSVFFPVTGGRYTKVCGSLIGYQNSHTDAFEAYNDGIATTIDEPYVSGVSLTHGIPREHIWTFAAGRTEIQPLWPDVCPCDSIINITVPDFVDDNYFCESGTNSGEPDGFHPDDPLWDGEGCTSSSECCLFNNPPYFKKLLPSPTFDDIEARICQWDTLDDTPIEFIELYVK